MTCRRMLDNESEHFRTRDLMARQPGRSRILNPAVVSNYLSTGALKDAICSYLETRIRRRIMNHQTAMPRRPLTALTRAVVDFKSSSRYTSLTF